MPDKYTIVEPPKDEGGGKYTIETPKDDDALGLAGKVIRAPADVARGIGDALVVNPMRSLGADLYAGGAHGLPTDDASRAEFWQRRDKALKATEIPKSKTSEVVEGVMSLPGEAIGKMASGVGDLMGQDRKAAVAPYATVAADALPLAGGLASVLRGPGAPRSVVEAGRATNRAREFLSERFQTGLYEGGPSAMELVEQMQKGRAADQPFTLLDANNPELRGAVGTVYRQGGGAQGRISDFLDQRHRGQVDRTERLIGEAMGDPSTFTQTEQALRQQRSANARPAFEEAAKGPGLKALETEFQNAWAAAGRAEFDAARAVSDAENRMTQARGRQDTAGNVYSSSASNSSVREAEAALVQARQQLTDAGRQKAGMRDLMDKARLDGTLRPDAVWSPYLDMLRRENPHVSRGLARGWDIERNKAHGAGERANPRDYAIVGFEENGEPIVGAVPNMRLWMVTKEGLDAEIADNIRANKGHPDKMGHSLIELRDGLVTELDRLNPRYAPARAQWQGDSAAVSALEHGGQLLDTGKSAWFKSDQEVAEYLGKLNPADRDFVKLGLAQELLNRVRRAPDAADKSKRVVNDDITRTRVEMLLGPDAGRFLESIQRESEMEKSRFETKGGSPTQPRRAADARNERKQDAIMRMFSGAFGALTHPWRALEAGRAGLRLRRLMSDAPDLPMNEAVGKMVTDPGLAISPKPGGPILPPIDVPRRYMMTPGRALAAGEALEPNPDDPLARVLGRR